MKDFFYRINLNHNNNTTKKKVQLKDFSYKKNTFGKSFSKKSQIHLFPQCLNQFQSNFLKKGNQYGNTNLINVMEFTQQTHKQFHILLM